MDYFDKLSRNIKARWKNFATRLRAYVKRLLFPLYLFPVKIVTYTLFYLVLFVFKLIFAFFGLMLDAVVFPFRSLKNFLKAVFFIAIAFYLLVTFVVIADYFKREYGNYSKAFCGYGVKEMLQKSVVRVVGGSSEGSGFFIAPDQVMTNFHVIADEPSPKIIFPDGSFETPIRIVGDQDADLAVLYTEKKHQDKVIPFSEDGGLYDDEPLLATGYPLGTDLKGEATIVRGNYIAYRQSKKAAVSYIQTNISLVEGMSGGPLTDQCGKVIGINTMSMAGLSLFILGRDAKMKAPSFTDKDIAKINVDPSNSPDDAVLAYYTYLKVRRMKDGFNLLSKDTVPHTDFREWTRRFTDVLSVHVYKVARYKDTDDTVSVKFSTKNWIDGEVEYHFFEGTWMMVKEDGIWKIQDGKILEVYTPGWSWYYE